MPCTEAYMYVLISETLHKVNTDTPAFAHVQLMEIPQHNNMTVERLKFLFQDQEQINGKLDIPNEAESFSMMTIAASGGRRRRKQHWTTKRGRKQQEKHQSQTPITQFGWTSISFLLPLLWIVGETSQTKNI